MAPPNNPYASVTFAQAKEALRLRLDSSGSDFWTDSERGEYIKEALRTWNSLTCTYIQDYTTQFSSAGKEWESLANGMNAFVDFDPTNPRAQKLDSNYLFTLVQYHFLEPPTGGTWTGTPQFNITDLAQAFQRRRDYILQQTGCNVGPFSTTYSMPPGQNRVYLPDTTNQSILDLRRVRFCPADPFAPNYFMYRDDGLAFEYFENDFTTTTDPPFAWDVLAGPPLALTFDAPANVPNTLDILAMLSGGTVTPPTAAPLLIPDDWNWVLKFGMMADLLRKEAESTDLERSDYCERRFQEGVKLMQVMPWVLQARINNIPCDTPSVAEADDFDNGWQDSVDAQLGIVRGGIDLIAMSPSLVGTGFADLPFGEGGFGGVTDPSAVTLSLVANQAVPSADGDFLQISRDVYDAILDYSEHLAQLKMGGFEFAESTRTLYKNFIQAAVNTNSRLRESGIFATTLRPPVSRQQPRFALTGANS